MTLPSNRCLGVRLQKRRSAAPGKNIARKNIAQRRLGAPDNGAEPVPESQRARLTCICKVGDEVVLDGGALVKVPSAAKSKRPLPKL
jgi:hypothetical protein